MMADPNIIEAIGINVLLYSRPTTHIPVDTMKSRSDIPTDDATPRKFGKISIEPANVGANANANGEDATCLPSVSL